MELKFNKALLLFYQLVLLLIAPLMELKYNI